MPLSPFLDHSDGWMSHSCCHVYLQKTEPLALLPYNNPFDKCKPLALCLSYLLSLSRSCSSRDCVDMTWATSNPPTPSALPFCHVCVAVGELAPVDVSAQHTPRHISYYIETRALEYRNGTLKPGGKRSHRIAYIGQVLAKGGLACGAHD